MSWRWYNSKMSIRVMKAYGKQEAFDADKMRRSLSRAGADNDAIDNILKSIEKEMYDGISTSELYHRAFKDLHGYKRIVAARYSLKHAVLEFGPSGFPFEAYIAELFRVEGSEANIDQIVQGACVEHEVDVVSKKDGITTYTEAKFHNSIAINTDLKVALYVKARMDDIRAMSQTPEKVHGLLVTNTRFTSMAIKYMTCQNLEVLAWDYPENSNLHDRIDIAGVYPVTALTSLSKREKTALLSEKVVLCTALRHEGDALLRAGVRGKRVDLVLEEAGALCVPGKGI